MVGGFKLALVCSGGGGAAPRLSRDHDSDSCFDMAVQSLAAMCSRVPILVILGATGTGKSKLSIDFAKKFCGEIISADSMQVYKGLDIITNKVTKEEQQQIPHHMFNEIDPLKKFTVVDFRNRALPILEDLINSKKFPIIVGGTNYYIEALLYKVLISLPPESNNIDTTILLEDREKSLDEPPNKKNKLDAEDDTASLYSKLCELDPERAQTLHPNNRRKIIRSLQIMSQNSVKHSVLIEKQKESGGSSLGGGLRWQNVGIFWVRCDQEILDKRLDERVDDMMKRGLIEELLEFHKTYNEDRLNSDLPPDYTNGIFQTIGFKEFHNYLILSEEDRSSPKGEKFLEEGISALKMATRRYSRKQLKWIKNRFLRKPDREVPPMFALNATDPSQWDKNVLEPAFKIVESLINKTPLPEGIAPLSNEIPLDNNIQETIRCEICQRTCVGTLQFKDHLLSKKHLKVKNRIEREKKIEKANKEGEKQNISVTIKEEEKEKTSETIEEEKEKASATN